MQEQSDNREREYKFEYRGDIDLVVNHLRAAARDGWALITLPPRAVMDLYFDTPRRDLLQAGSTLRLRKRRINPGWNLNFKEPPLSGEHDFFDRHEIITALDVEEALEYQESGIPGLGWRLALAFAKERGFPATFAPCLYVISWRSSWTIRPGDVGDRQSNWLSLFRDQVTAFALDGQRPQWIIEHGALDYTLSSPRTSEFETYEVEASGRSIDDEAGAVAALRLVTRNLVAVPGVITVTENKYQRATRLLQ